MKSIIVICIVLSVLEGYYSVPSDQLEEVNREKRNTPSPGVLIEDLSDHNAKQHASAEDVPKSRPILRTRRQTRPGFAGRPQVLPTRPSGGYQNQPHITTFVRPQPRNRREAQQSGSAGQPQVQPTRPTREVQNQPDLEAQRTRRQTRPASVGQPQVLPLSPSRENQNHPHANPSVRPQPRPQPRPLRTRRQTRPGSVGRPQVQPIRPSRENQNHPQAIPVLRPQPLRTRRQTRPSPPVQPQVLPISPSRENQNHPHATPIVRPLPHTLRVARDAQNRPPHVERYPPTANTQPGRLTKDIPKQKYRREASGNPVGEAGDEPKGFEMNTSSLKLHVNDAPVVVEH